MFDFRRWTKTIRNRGRRRPRAAGKNPPIAGDVPDTLELVVGNEIYIAKDGLPPGLRNRLLRLAAFQNPEFYKAQAMRLPTYDKPRIIACAEDYPQHIGLPRGCMEDVQQLLSDLNITPVVRDERCHGQPLQRDLSRNAPAGAKGGGRFACWSTIRVCWPRRRRSGKQLWRPG